VSLLQRVWNVMNSNVASSKAMNVILRELMLPFKKD
jgi:hypothetical protein